MTAPIPVRIWDLPTRVFHVALAALVAAAIAIAQTGSTLVSIDDEKNEAVIETTPGTKLRVHRQVISRVIDPIEAQPREACFQRRRHDVGDPAELTRWHTNLGADNRGRRFQTL